MLSLQALSLSAVCVPKGFMIQGQNVPAFLNEIMLTVTLSFCHCTYLTLWNDLQS